MNIYNYLKNLLNTAKKEIKNNYFVFLLTLVLVTIPLPYIYNSIAIILFLIVSVYSFRLSKITFQGYLVLPILLYILMLLSLLWTHDYKLSVRALSKELPLLIVPLCFFLNPIKNNIEKEKITSLYAKGIFSFTVFYLIKAIVKFVITGNVSVFFYHELVTFDVNAIHVSVYVALAFFIFFTKKQKTIFDLTAIVTLLLLLILLSSKNIIIVFFLLFAANLFQNAGKVNQKKAVFAILFILGLLSVLFFGRIKERFWVEIESNIVEKSRNKSIGNSENPVYNVSIKDAWYKDQFQPNDFFPGTAFRIYQLRIFFEMLDEDPIFFKGYGLNATDFKIAEKRKEHNLYQAYENFNFHNQFIQLFAEIGFFGFLILLLMLGVTFYRAILNRDFIHFTFVILMTSLFFTESFLSRQRGVVFFIVFFCLLNGNKLFGNRSIRSKI